MTLSPVPGFIVMSNEQQAAIVAGVLRHDPAALEELYAIARRFRMRLRRTFRLFRGVLVDDLVHDFFIRLVALIQSGKVQQHDRLVAFCVSACEFFEHSMIRRYRRRCRAQSRGLLRTDIAPDDVYAQALVSEQRRLSRISLQALDGRELEIIRRFYFSEQPPERIISELGLTPNQYRNGKHESIVKMRVRIERRQRAAWVKYSRSR